MATPVSERSAAIVKRGSKMPESTAVLLLAHERDAQALAYRASLIARHVGPVFLHLDAKAGEEAYVQLGEALSRLEGEGGRVERIATRVSVHWGGDDMLLAMLALLDAARAQGPFEHYVFASSTHYPLQERDDVKSILASLKGHSGRESKPMPYKQILKRLVLPFDKVRRRTHFAPAALVANLSALGAFWSRYGRPRWGSQWVVIAREDLQAIDASRETVERGGYRHWKILDEVFFQTVLRRSGRDFLSTRFVFAPDNSGSPQAMSYAEARTLARTDRTHVFARKLALGAECTGPDGAFQHLQPSE